MIDVALTFLSNNLNAYLKVRTGSDLGTSELSRLVDDSGKWAIDKDRIGVTLINVEEDRILRAQVPEITYVNGRNVIVPPPLKVNLHVLFAANFQQYDQALKYLALVLTYFQTNPSFTETENSDLDAGIDKLTLELISLSYEQLNQIWQFIGGKQLPSVVYRVRMLLLQDAQSDLGAPITRIDAQLQGK